MPPELDFRPPDRLLGRARHESLGSFHRVSVVRVRLVPLELRELGRVLVRHALVAEILRELVDLLETTDDQALQVELVGDAEVDVLVEVVRMGDERLRESTAVTGLENRRLDLDEAFAVEIRADRRDHQRADDRVAPRVLVHQQVEVALAVPDLGVGNAVERVGKRAADLPEQHHLVDGDRRLAATRLRRAAGHPHDVAQVEIDRAGARRVAQQLDPAAAVDEVEEDELPHLPAPEHAPGGAHDRLGLCARLEPLRLGAHFGERHRVRKALGRHA